MTLSWSWRMNAAWTDMNKEMKVGMASKSEVNSDFKHSENDREHSDHFVSLEELKLENG